MSIVSVTTGLIAHLNAEIPNMVPYPQNQNLSNAVGQRSIQIVTRMNPNYTGVGGDIKQNYVFILEVEYKSDSDPTVDSALGFDNFLIEIMDALQNREALDRLQQRQSIKLEKGITDIADYPFSNLEPGLFKKIITIKGYKIR